MTVSSFYDLRRLYKQKPAGKCIFGNAVLKIDGWSHVFIHLRLFYCWLKQGFNGDQVNFAIAFSCANGDCFHFPLIFKCLF